MKNSGKQMKERITMIAKKSSMKKSTIIVTGIGVLLMLMIILVSLTKWSRTSEPVITVFINENITEKQRSQLESQLLEVDGVTSYDYTSAEEAWESFKKEYLEESYAESFEENPLENSDNYTIWVETASDLKQVKNQIMEIEGVRRVNSVID
jgi:cell division transport system permease protein